MLFEEMTEINSDKSMYELIKHTTLNPEFREENVVLQTLQVTKLNGFHLQHEYESSGIQFDLDPRVNDAQNAIQTLQYQFSQVDAWKCSRIEHSKQLGCLFNSRQSADESKFIAAISSFSDESQLQNPFECCGRGKCSLGNYG